jgi:hypothetical protein
MALLTQTPPSLPRCGTFANIVLAKSIGRTPAERADVLGLEPIAPPDERGATQSIYGYDPDGNEFEVMWMVPRERWGEYERSAPTRRLDLEAEIARWSARSKA